MHLSRAVRLACVVAIAACGGPLAGQTTMRVVGRIEPVLGPTTCNQSLTHRIECSRIYLVSSAIDLNAWIGQVVDLVGTDQGVTCVVLDVTQAQSAAGTLTVSGTSTLGSRLDFILTGPSYGFGAAYLGSSPAVLPLDLTLGTLLVAPPLYFLGGGLGIFRIAFHVIVPVDPTLIGYEIYLQSVHQSIGPLGPPFLGNPICFTLS